MRKNKDNFTFFNEEWNYNDEQYIDGIDERPKTKSNGAVED